MATLDLASLVNNAINTSSGLDQSLAKVDANNTAAQSLSQASANVSNAQADAEATITQADLEAKQREEQERQELALRLGMDPKVSGSLINQAAEKEKQGFAMLADARERIHQKQSVGFLDSPIDWLANQFTIHKDIADYNNAAGIINEQRDLTETLSQNFTEGVQVLHATNSTINDAYISASKIVKSAQAQREAIQAGIQGIQMNMQGINLAMGIKSEQAKLLFEANSAMNQAQQIDISLKHLRLQNDEFDLKKAAVKEKKDEEDFATELVATGYRNLNGGQEMSPDIQNKILLRLKNKDPRVQAWYDSGVSSYGTGTAIVSPSPFRVTEYAGTKMLTSLPSAQMGQVVNQLVTWRKEFDAQALQTQGFDPKDKSAHERAFNDYVDKKIRTSPESYEIFKPMALKDFTAHNNNMAGLPVWNKILAPAAQSGANVDDPNVAFALITSALGEGKLSYPDAVDYSALVSGAYNARLQANNMLAFGLNKPTKYESNVKLTSNFGSDKVNIVDQNSVARAINRAMGIRATQMFGTPDAVFGVAPTPLGAVSSGYDNTFGRIKFGGKPTDDEESRSKALEQYGAGKK